MKTKNEKTIKTVVVLGGGTAGWMSAALLKKVLGAAIDIELVESETIGTVGVGEATIPPIRIFNQVLGINEAEFIRETKATIKLGIRFDNWNNIGDSYLHSFGAPGRSSAFCQFHHYLKRAQLLGLKDTLWDYDLNALCADAGKFAVINSKDPVLELPHAYHFDAGLYAKFLRKFSEKLGVKRTEGLVENVQQCADSGNVQALILKDGSKVSGDLFVDCSGMRALLIEDTMKTGYENWSQWLTCDRALAVPSQRFDKTLPYTRSIAHAAGWQWRIPLQHRNGNGLVYSSAHFSDQQAHDLLLNNLESKAIGDPKLFKFEVGRRKQQWHKNVIAVGLSSGFLEPLESTSIHLIQSAIVRLLHLFPHNGIEQSSIAEYNKQSQVEYEQIRDFIILHYHANQRSDSDFWQYLGNMDIPATLQHKIQLFKDNGRLFRDQNDLFLDASWLQVMVGQGIEAKDYHPIADNMAEAQLIKMLTRLKEIKNDPIPKLPNHDAFIENICKV